MFQIAILSLLILLLNGCSQDDKSILIYQTKKEVFKEGSVDSNSGAVIRWTTPKGWTAGKSNSIRIGSFSLQGSPQNMSDKADVSIVLLAGTGGGDFANVNRWRQQIELPKWTEVEVIKKSLSGKSKLAPFKYWFLKNKNNNKAIVVAIYKTSRGSIFIKMTGSLKTLRYRKKEFITFCEGINEG